MPFKSPNSDRDIESILDADISRAIAEHSTSKIEIASPSGLLSLSDRQLAQKLADEREEASHQLAILANSIFASVGL